MESKAEIAGFVWLIRAYSCGLIFLLARRLVRRSPMAKTQALRAKSGQYLGLSLCLLAVSSVVGDQKDKGRPPTI